MTVYTASTDSSFVYKASTGVVTVKYAGTADTGSLIQVVSNTKFSFSSQDTNTFGAKVPCSANGSIEAVVRYRK